MMKKTITLFVYLTISAASFAQLADFENLGLATNQYLNGSDGSGGFDSGNFFFPNNYNSQWGSWSGWAVSTMTDTQTPGFENQYSAITGSGADGSATYAVSFVAGHSSIDMTSGQTSPLSVQVTNSTYAYLSMLNGDAFAKKFGGADGNDPDWFLLTIKAYKNGQPLPDSIDFYLADYRFDDNSQDYIVDQWTTIDLSTFGEADSLSFSLSSSDVGDFGMNTPAYFCLDNLNALIVPAREPSLPQSTAAVFPNPATSRLFVDWKDQSAATGFLFSPAGKLLKQFPLSTGHQPVDIHLLPSGVYILKIQSEKGRVSKRVVINNHR